MATKPELKPPSRRARQWATMFSIPGVLILLALGSWQLQRLVWKNELNDFRQAQITAEPAELPLTVADPAAMSYRPVWVEGVFRHDAEMILGARSHRNQVGYQVITPLVRADGSQVLINRGWIHADNRDPATRQAGQVEGMQRVEGLLVLGSEEHWITAENRPDENFWFWLDLASLSAAANIPTQQFIIEANDAPNPGGLPIGGQSNTELRNEHLQYAIIWFSLAVGLTAIYIIFIRGQRKRTSTPS